MPNSGVNFEIWTADQLRAQATTYADALADNVNNQPLGRGVATKLDCDRGIQSGSGTCLSADLTWTGALGSGGTYFVRIVNANSTETRYQLLIDGATVRLAPLTQIAATTAPTSPAAAPPLVTAADPTKAIAIDGQQHSVAAGTVVWHRFDYDLKDDRTRPVVTIRLVNGTNSGVNFEIWTADQLRAQATTYADA
ncbi:MAG: hypothetical protein HY782_12060, partial [Chloroflexi bacterium]|nr:hypothetical protein [Chloroflexota bacterium]